MPKFVGWVVGDANGVFWVFLLFLVFFHERRLGGFLLGVSTFDLFS
jgi:hypothetical protein